MPFLTVPSRSHPLCLVYTQTRTFCDGNEETSVLFPQLIAHPSLFFPPDHLNCVGRARATGRKWTRVLCWPTAVWALSGTISLLLTRNCRWRCHCGRWARHRGSRTRQTRRGRSHSSHGPGSVGRWHSRIARRCRRHRLTWDCPGRCCPRRGRHTRCW